MPDNPNPDIAGTGQGDVAPTNGITATAPDPADAGQVQEPGTGTSDNTPGQPLEESFFDPTTVPEELKPAYKQMHAAFTKKMQSFSKHKDKISAYDAFMSDPVGQLQLMAKQYGFNIVPPGQQPAPKNETFEPQTWDEVVSHIESKLMDKIRGQMQPIVDNVQKMTATNIEKELDELDPMWRNYEDDMKAALRAHPTLVNDVSKLYRLAVPEEVLNSKATQQALKKLEQKTKAAQVHGSRGVSKSAPAPKKVGSFREAVEAAREQGKQEGWYR